MQNLGSVRGDTANVFKTGSANPKNRKYCMSNRHLTPQASDENSDVLSTQLFAKVAAVEYYSSCSCAAPCATIL